MCTDEKENASFSSDYSYDSFEEDDDDDSFGGGGGGGIVHRKVFGDTSRSLPRPDSWDDTSRQLSMAMNELGGLSDDDLLELDEISDVLAHGTEDQMVRLSHCLF